MTTLNDLREIAYSPTIRKHTITNYVYLSRWLPLRMPMPQVRYALYDADGTLLALYDNHGDAKLARMRVRQSRGLYPL